MANNTLPKGMNKLTFVIVAVVVVAVAGILYFKFFQKNEASDFNLENEVASEKTFEERASTAQLACDPQGGHTNFRTQQAFAIDPRNSNIMYIGVEYKGVYKSTDGGVTWEKSDEGIKGYYKSGTKEKCVQELGKIVIDPTNSQRLLVSRIDTPGTITDWFSETAGVYLSEDSGKSWKQLVKGDMNASGSKGIAFYPSDTKTIFYGTNNSPASYGGADKTKFFNKKGILYKSTDSGKTWTELNTGIDQYLRTSDVLLDNSNPDRVFLATFRPGGQDGNPDLNPDQSKRLLVSEDGGKTWESIASRIPETGAVMDIMQSAKNPKNLFVILQAVKSSDRSGTAYSVDGGKTFISSSAKGAYAAAYDPHASDGMRILTYLPFENQPGIHESLDGGKSWNFFSTLPSVIDGRKVRISNITWDPSKKTTVYANGDYGYLLKSEDNGKTWKVLVSKEDL